MLFWSIFVASSCAKQKFCSTELQLKKYVQLWHTLNIVIKLLKEILVPKCKKCEWYGYCKLLSNLFASILPLEACQKNEYDSFRQALSRLDPNSKLHLFSEISVDAAWNTYRPTAPKRAPKATDHAFDHMSLHRSHRDSYSVTCRTSCRWHRWVPSLGRHEARGRNVDWLMNFCSFQEFRPFPHPWNVLFKLCLIANRAFVKLLCYHVWRILYAGY